LWHFNFPSSGCTGRSSKSKGQCGCISWQGANVNVN
jgi:hypothetical protein